MNKLTFLAVSSALFLLASIATATAAPITIAQASEVISVVRLDKRLHAHVPACGQACLLYVRKAGAQVITYTLIRFYQRGESEEISSGHSLEEVKEYCRDKETSSRTCEEEENTARTEKHGAWFVGYREN